MPANIVHVEDDRGFQWLVNYLLDLHCHRVTSCKAFEDAIEGLSRQAPDLILCDPMPSISGSEAYTLAKWCREQPHLQGVPVICLTSRYGEYSPDKAKENGLGGILFKPIIPQTFVHEVESYLPPGKHGTPPGKTE